MKWMEPLTDQEIDALVRGYDDDRLRENYAKAAEQPGTEWHRILLAEMYRRGLFTEGPA
jgi:hypothetical protein